MIYCNHQATLFGGGVKKLLHKPTLLTQTTQQILQSQIQKDGVDNNETDVGMWNTVTSLTMQRVKLNMKLLGGFGASQATTQMKEDKPTYREQFVAPEMSMISYFLIKPILTGIY